MEAILIVAVIAAIVVGAVKLGERSKRESAVAAHVGRVRHWRSGQFPSTCSWCRNTALAKKMIVVHRDHGAWGAVDMGTRIATCPDGEVEGLAALLLTDHPAWRRLCTEKCSQEFFGAEKTINPITFTSCGYCSARHPSELAHCIHCGAPNRGPANAHAPTTQLAR